jgi:hypothetical protein
MHTIDKNQVVKTQLFISALSFYIGYAEWILIKSFSYENLIVVSLGMEHNLNNYSNM